MKFFIGCIVALFFLMGCKENLPEKEVIKVEKFVVEEKYVPNVNLIVTEYEEYDDGYVKMIETEEKLTKDKPILKFEGFTFKSDWFMFTNKRDPEYFIKYYQISKLEIYKGDTLLQTIKNFEDLEDIGLIINFYDYNMDGFVDMNFLSIKRTGATAHYDYFLYNPTKKMFVYNKKWDFIKVNRLKFDEKIIETHFDGNSCEGVICKYKVDGSKIKKIATDYINNCKD